MRLYKEFYKEFEKLPFFNEKQLVKQRSLIVEFLKKIYPSTKEDTFIEGAIELRFLRREHYPGATFVKSYNTWRFDEKDTDKLTNKLAQINGEVLCSYYSGYSFDYKKETFDSKNKKRAKGKINNDNALYTQILPMDFDNISYEKFLEEKQRLVDVGIQTIDIFTGHGYQSIILLTNKSYDKKLFKKFTELLLSKGFKVDSALIDTARVLRLPYTFNNKSYDKNNTKYSEYNKKSIATTIIHDTDERYDVKDVFKRLNELPTIDMLEGQELPFIDENDDIESNIEIEKEVVVSNNENVSFKKEININELKNTYGDYLRIEDMELSLQKILNKTPLGVRNAAMLFLVPFFKNTMKLNETLVQKIMIVWGSRCVPAYSKYEVEKEVHRLWLYDFKGNYGRYTKELASVFGYFDLDSYTRKNSVYIENEVFEKLSTLKDTSFKIYLRLRLEKHLIQEKKKKKEHIEKQSWTIDEMAELLDVSDKTIKRYLKDLVDHELFIKIKGNKRAGIKDSYYPNPYTTKSKGYTLFMVSTMRFMLSNLTDGEMKLYSYICRVIGDGSRECFMSQKNLAEKIGKKKNSVSEMTDSLVLKKFIIKYTYNKGYMTHCCYELKY